MIQQESNMSHLLSSAATRLSATDSNPILVESTRSLSATDSNPIILSKSTHAAARSCAPPRSPRPKLPPPWRLLKPAVTPAAADVSIAPHFAELAPGSIVGDLYAIDEKLGAGTMGEVYAARHVKLGKQVAIKVIHGDLCQDDAAMDRFAMEARTLAQIQHPAIVAVEHVGELPDGRAYFVMEFLRGESLADRIERAYVPTSEALRVLDQMARALEAAHTQGVVHRDLKPENTYLVHLPGEEPIIKLLDFGLAKLAESVDDRAERTRSGTAVGTPLYMSPEQARGSADVDCRADIYALGCIAYKLVLGHQLFEYAKTAPEMFAAHLHATPPAPRTIWPKIPKQLDECLLSMLAKDPADRPTLPQIRADLANVRTALLEARAPARDVAASRGDVSPSRRFSRTSLLAVVAIVLVGSLTIGDGASETSPIPTHLTHAAIAARLMQIHSIPPVEHASAPIATAPITEPPPLDHVQTIDAPPTSVAVVPRPHKVSWKAPSDRGARSSQLRETVVAVTPDATPPVTATATEEIIPMPPPPPPDKNMTVNPFKGH